MQRRESLTVLAALAASWATPAALAQAQAQAQAQAADYPSRQIRLISPYGAGGGNDTISRMLATRLGDVFKQRLIVDNKPGGNTIIGNEFVAKAPPDGYTLIVNGNGFVTNPSFYAKIPFDTVKDFAPVAYIASTQLVLVATSTLPASNVREVIALAKAKPHTLNFGNSGQGGPEHLAGVMFAQMSGTEIGSVPYKGAAPAITDLIGGQVQLMITALAAVQPHIQAGKLKLIAMANNERSSRFPNVPTIAEAGLPGFDTSLWYGMMAPAGTPPAIVQRLNTEINKILREKETQDFFAERGLTAGNPAKVGTPELFGAFIKSEIATAARVARAAGIKPE